MSSQAHTNVDEYIPSEGGDQPPSEAESAILTVLMFGGLVVFAVGCMIVF